MSTFTSTYEVIGATSARIPDQIALRFLAEVDQEIVTTWTYRELFDQITRFANWLHSVGVSSKDAVSIMLPNVPQFHFAFWGAEAAAIANPINPLLGDNHIAAIMRQVETRVLVTLAQDSQNDAWAKIETLAQQVPSLKYILVVDPAVPVTGRQAVLSSARSGSIAIAEFDASIASQPGDCLRSGRRFESSDIAAYFHTGGTTGLPKVAQHTHGNEVAMAESLASALEMQGGNFLCGLPLFHVNGITVTGLLPFLTGGSVLLATAAGYRGPGVIQNFWKLIEKNDIHVFSGVPTVYSTLLEVPIGDADVRSLRYGICGAAPLSPELLRRFETATGICILEGYGLTEAACASTLNPIRGERRIGSIGRALPGIEVKAVELDAAGNYVRDCANNVVGQLVIRGATVFPGYLDGNNNAGLFLQGGWLKTGDLGRRDASGCFWLAGRAKDLIVRSGHNIDPAVIEEALIQHPAVALAAAVGRPDRLAGELPVAYVELRPGQFVPAADLQAHAAAIIAERAAVPKAVHVIDRMPLTAVGKVFKPALVWRETEDAFANALVAVSGIAKFRVKVAADARYGTLAQITVSPAAGVSQAMLTDAISDSLGTFTTRYQIAYEAAV